MQTKDFTGTYDYERGEAQGEAEYFIKAIQPDRTPDECKAYVDKIARHWQKVLCANGFADFRDEWNKLVPQYPINR